MEFRISPANGMDSQSTWRYACAVKTEELLAREREYRSVRVVLKNPLLVWAPASELEEAANPPDRIRASHLHRYPVESGS